MLEELSRSLYEAISDSEDVHLRLQDLREQGYCLNLLLDCQPDSENSSDDDDAGDGELAQRSLRPLHSTPNPTFRINSTDLAFLRSVGIDPTRRCKKRRRRSSDKTKG